MALSRTNRAAGSGGGPPWELLYSAAAAPPRRRTRALADALRGAVREGLLAPGTRLPSSRDLAGDLGVSRGLVTEVYQRLLAEGCLISRQGAGTWVAALPRPPATAPAVATGAAGPAEAAAPAAGAEAASTDFRPGLPDLSLFPRAAWAAAQRDALAALPHAVLDYPDPRGLPALRTALAELLARRRNVAVGPDSVVVVFGVAQALTLIGRVLRARGHRTVAVEEPGSPQENALLRQSGLDIAALPVDAEGPDVAALRRSGARAAVVTPAHQFPTGVACAPGRRAELLSWARSVDGLLIEDDYDGDFRYDRAPVGALQGLAPELVAYTGSVSKSLAPGLRLGWLVPPPGLLAEVVEAKRVADLGNPVPEQAALAEFVRSGRYDRQLRRCGRTYRERRDALISALEAGFPGVRITGIAAGLHLIAELPAPVPPAVAARAGVRLHPLAEYRRLPEPERRPGGPGPAALDRRYVFGYPHLTPREITAAVARLAAEATAEAGAEAATERALSARHVHPADPGRTISVSYRSPRPSPPTSRAPDRPG
ncbi:MocR-like pyridoxine biosynthesis transcription factor PdxR [Phaeacidiphilus oryzae]|uniref:MocR-like pyridoxine biosynthesis transcription factor PdxR n=1 Tax=Phaeacidiphilus oryzae TaxID=348818 RepID=UPI0007C7641C|nr:PLP-dependent aminotransferase family protein [Phaeacidiphilus oryzae]